MLRIVKHARKIYPGDRRSQLIYIVYYLAYRIWYYLKRNAEGGKCYHLAEEGWIKYILKQTDHGEYFPLTGYRCSKCGEEFVSDGIWWVMQGIPGNVIFEPEPDENEIIIDVGFGKIKSIKVKEA